MTVQYKPGFKPGTKIEMHGTPAFSGFPGVKPEIATIGRMTKRCLPMPGPDWHVVRFADGGALCVHETGFRVISNGSA